MSSLKHGNHLFFLMAATISLFICSLFFSASFHVSFSHRLPFSPTTRQRSYTLQACNATTFPQTCLSSLSSYPQTSDAVQIIQSAASVSLANLKEAQGMVQSILTASSDNVNRSSAATNCVELLENSYNRAAAAVDRRRLLSNSKDSLAWLSAALLYQYDCWSALKYANDTSMTDRTMSFLSSLMMLSSNALAMVRSLDAFGTDIFSWSPPKTERDGFWLQPRSTGYFTGGVPSYLAPDVTVCRQTECNYKTVQEAVDTAPDNTSGRKFVIKIKEGVYDEIVKVPVQKKNIVFLGDGIGRTVITGSLSAGQPGISTYNTATVAVLGDGFMARDLTVQNTAGPPTHQAVAFRSDSDLSVIENCEFLGNQDTLYAHSLRQYYKSCRIVGNVDFVFGNSASVFDGCLIQINPRQIKPEKGENNAITAHGRTDPSQSTGFVFRNCIINGTEQYMALVNSNPEVHRNYLGRPWKEYSRTVFIGCNLASIVSPPGWMPWSKDFALKTLYYGEYGNSGLGADTSNRVSWSSLIPPEHVDSYSPTNFIQGDLWIPSLDLK